MNCFTASAFDHDDIDAVYDKAICPVLAELIPIRRHKLNNSPMEPYDALNRFDTFHNRL